MTLPVLCSYLSLFSFSLDSLSVLFMLPFCSYFCSFLFSLVIFSFSILFCPFFYMLLLFLLLIFLCIFIYLFLFLFFLLFSQFFNLSIQLYYFCKHSHFPCYIPIAQSNQNNRHRLSYSFYGLESFINPFKKRLPDLHFSCYLYFRYSLNRLKKKSLFLNVWFICFFVRDYVIFIVIAHYVQEQNLLMTLFKLILIINLLIFIFSQIISLKILFGFALKNRIWICIFLILVLLRLYKKDKIIVCVSFYFFSQKSYFEFTLTVLKIFVLRLMMVLLLFKERC